MLFQGAFQKFVLRSTTNPNSKIIDTFGQAAVRHGGEMGKKLFGTPTDGLSGFYSGVIDAPGAPPGTVMEAFGTLGGKYVGQQTGIQDGIKSHVSEMSRTVINNVPEKLGGMGNAAARDGFSRSAVGVSTLQSIASGFPVHSTPLALTKSLMSPGSGK